MWEDTPKTLRSVRLVPIGPAAAQMLLAWRQVSGGVGYVFHGFRGPEFIEDSRRDYDVWVKAEKRAGVEHVRLHAARGSAASLMASRVPAFVAAEILGDSENVMQRYYTRGSSEQRELAARSVEPE
jgi:integrase